MSPPTTGWPSYVFSHGAQDTTLPVSQRAAPHPLRPHTLCSCFGKCFQHSGSQKPQRLGGGVSCTLGNYVPIVKENTLCPRERETRKGDPGAPDKTTEALCVVRVCTHPPTLKNPNPSEAALDTSKALRFHWAFGVTQEFSHPRGCWVLCGWQGAVIIKLSVVMVGSGLLGAGGGTWSLHQEPPQC